MSRVAEITAEELEIIEKEFHPGSSIIKSVKEFASPEELYQDLVIIVLVRMMVMIKRKVEKVQRKNKCKERSISSEIFFFYFFPLPLNTEFS